MSTHFNVDATKVDAARLRQFGVVVGLVIVSVFGILFPLIRRHSSPTWIWIGAAILIFLGLLAPSTLRPIYLVWMQIGRTIATIETSIILGIVFYGLVTPMSFIMRLLRYDPMKRRLWAKQSSYRQRSEVKPASSMENPY